MQRLVPILLVLALAACGGAAPAEPTVVVETPPPAAPTLIIAGDASNYGRDTLEGGFLPDPATVEVQSGGPLDASAVLDDPSCAGFVTAEPDYILDYENPADWLRIFAVSEEDTTLIINDGAGNWHCNDDSVGYNPVVDIPNPPGGQYDIWVGSYAEGELHPAILAATEIQDIGPDSM